MNAPTKITFGLIITASFFQCQPNTPERSAVPKPVYSSIKDTLPLRPSGKTYAFPVGNDNATPNTRCERAKYS